MRAENHSYFIGQCLLKICPILTGWLLYFTFQGHLDKLHHEISRTLEKIGSREKYINNQVTELKVIYLMYLIFIYNVNFYELTSHWLMPCVQHTVKIYTCTCDLINSISGIHKHVNYIFFHHCLKFILITAIGHDHHIT